MQIVADLEHSEPVGTAEERAAERKSVQFAGGIRRQNVTSQVTVLDMSTTGFRVRLASPVPVGSVVWLKIPGLEGLQSRIVWLDGLIAGCQLAGPLHPAVFQHIVQRAAAH